MINRAGTYRAKAVDVQLGTSKSKGTPYVGVSFKIIGGEFDGQSIVWNGWLTDATAKRTLESLQYCGWTGDDLSDFTRGLSGLDRNEVEIVVGMEPGMKDPEKSYPKVEWVNRIGSGSKFNGEAMDVSQAAAFGQKFKGLAMALKAANGATPAPKPETINPDDLTF